MPDVDSLVNCTPEGAENLEIIINDEPPKFVNQTFGRTYGLAGLLTISVELSDHSSYKLMLFVYTF